MKKLSLAVLSLLSLCVIVYAEEMPPVSAVENSAAAVAPVVSTETPSVGITGETVGAPTPEAMTDTPGAGVFITLSRSAISNRDLPFNTQVVSPATFRTYDAQNAGDAISRLTSVSVAPQGQLGTLRLSGIRGATSNQTMVLIDGRPVGGVGLSGSQDLAEVPIEQIDRIEVVRGGVSALYGPNALGGVINIITKRATHEGLPAADVSYEHRSYDTSVYRLNFGSRYGPFDYYFFGNQQMESGFRDNSDARTHNIGGNVGLSMGAGGKLLFDVAAYQANTGISGQLIPDLPPNQFNNGREKQASTPDSRQITDSRYLRTSYLLPLPMDSLATLRLFGSERQVEFAIPSFFIDTDRHEQSHGGEAQFNLPLGFLVGGSFLHDREDSRDLNNPANNFVAFVENWGVFAQETFKWKTLTLIPSGRFDHNSRVGDSKNPRVQTLWDVTEWFRFSSSAGRSFRAPTIDDQLQPFTDYGGYSYEGNPSLRPEKAWTYDAGFEIHPDSFSVKVGYFRANITDLIQTTPDLAATTVNVGKARRQGMEIELGHVWTPFFRHSVNYTYLENVGVVGADFSNPTPSPDYVTLRLSPRHTVNYMATLAHKQWSWSHTLRYVGTRFEGNAETNTKLGDYTTWGMRLSYQLRQMEVFIGVDDITNKRYEERGGYPLPGVTAYGGVSLRLWG